MTTKSPLDGPGEVHTRKTAHMPPQLALRPRETAAALGISERKLWSMTAAGEVPHVKAGRATLYPVALLTDWLKRKAEAGGK